MKKYLFIILLVGVWGCEKNKESAKKIIPQREQILNRHNNGEKKVVVVYTGKGLDEKLIKRLTFNKDGQIELLEDKKNKIIDYYLKGELVKRKHKNKYYNILSLIKSDTVKTKLLFNQLAKFIHRNDSAYALNILTEIKRFEFNGTTIQGNWVSESSWSFSDRYLDTYIGDYSLSFSYIGRTPVDGKYTLYIHEWGKYLPSNNYYSKTYKITKLGPVVNEGYIEFSYVEEDIKTGSIIGEEYSNNIYIVDPFEFRISAHIFKRDEYNGVKKSQLLWD
tara:strand:+ start:73 stop:903 length:831 start_codon:yes stop_codon:yes gene_type:complete